jgi:transcriptional regulator with XRE-family HTH domain
MEPKADFINIMILAKTLKTLIDQRGLTVSQLARASGVNQKTLYNWMIHQKPRNIEQVKKVADYFKVSVDHLCFGPSRIALTDILGTDDFHAGEYEVIIRPIRRKSTRL